MGKKIPLVVTDNRELNQYQLNVQGAMAPVLACNIPFGAQLASVQLVAGDNPVQHGLNRALNGWFLVRNRGTATLYDKYDTQDTSIYPKTQFIVINSSADSLVDIYVY